MKLSHIAAVLALIIAVVGAIVLTNHATKPPATTAPAAPAVQPEPAPDPAR